MLSIVPSVRRSAVNFVLACAVACSSSTESSAPKGTHPDGVVVETFAMPYGAHGVAISQSGTVVVGEYNSDDVRVASVNSFAFGPQIPAGEFPIDAAVTADGHTAFVADLYGSAVAVIDLLADSVEESIHVSAPLRVLLTPNGQRLYITASNLTDANTSTVYVLDVQSHTLTDSITVGAIANGIAYDAALGHLYVSTQGDYSIYDIDAASDRVVRQLHIGGIPQDIALTADHSELWVADEQAGVRVFDLASGTELDRIYGTSKAFGLAISPDGARVYVTQPQLSNAVIIDRPSRTILATILPGSSPQRVAFNASGTRAVVTDDREGAILIR